MTEQDTTERRRVEFACEFRPHDEDLSGVSRDSPAPRGGAFVTSARFLPKDLWARIEASGHCVYYDAEMLEDFGMFRSPTGWRYDTEGLQMILDAEMRVAVQGVEIGSTAEVGNALEEAARRLGEAAAGEAEEEARREAERLRKGEEYAAWRAEVTAGLTETSAMPERGEVVWSELRSFGEEIPGTGHATGDRWYAGEIDGRAVFLRAGGYIVTAFAPRETADRWILSGYRETEKRYGAASAAQSLLFCCGVEGDPVLGGDAMARLVEIFGAEHFVGLAASEPWYIRPGVDFPEDEEAVARDHGIEPVMLEMVAKPDVDYDPKQTPIDHPNPTKIDPFFGSSAIAVWKDQGERLIGETTETEFFELSADQRRALERAL